jgi:hypothetical protein
MMVFLVLPLLEMLDKFLLHILLELQLLVALVGCLGPSSAHLGLLSDLLVQ